MNQSADFGGKGKLITKDDAPIYKVITVGDPGIGKTSLLKKLKSGKFSDDVTEAE